MMSGLTALRGTIVGTPTVGRELLGGDRHSNFRAEGAQVMCSPVNAPSALPEYRKRLQSKLHNG